MVCVYHIILRFVRDDMNGKLCKEICSLPARIIATLEFGFPQSYTPQQGIMIHTILDSNNCTPVVGHIITKMDSR